MSEEKKGFIVKDRRIFSEDAQDVEKEEEKKETAAEETKEEVTREEPAPEEAESTSQFPEINFATFIFSLNSSALVHLGVIEDPATGQKKSLPMAKQTIDILGVLEEKTRGNLTEEEENLLKHILSDLRLMYVKEKG
ncbi:hypothetical protein LCGC14_1449600 [marine sediment metagenome]|uniref:DUF1844 domain-containing protein n=1 Tax=marine sediment metagenome TaxID=412755 RepID=A0A0F9JI64_9ZZZZ